MKVLRKKSENNLAGIGYETKRQGSKRETPPVGINYPSRAKRPQKRRKRKVLGAVERKGNDGTKHTGGVKGGHRRNCNVFVPGRARVYSVAITNDTVVRFT